MNYMEAGLFLIIIIVVPILLVVYYLDSKKEKPASTEKFQILPCKKEKLNSDRSNITKLDVFSDVFNLKNYKYV